MTRTDLDTKAYTYDARLELSYALDALDAVQEARLMGYVWRALATTDKTPDDYDAREALARIVLAQTATNDESDLALVIAGAMALPVASPRGSMYCQTLALEVLNGDEETADEAGRQLAYLFQRAYLHANKARSM